MLCYCMLFMCMYLTSSQFTLLHTLSHRGIVMTQSKQTLAVITLDNGAICFPHLEVRLISGHQGWGGLTSGRQQDMDRLYGTKFRIESNF